MSQGIIKVTLNRDGASTPWGFRLHGGKDIGFPLVIQRVFLGSPSEGDLHRGDVLVQVQDRDAGGLTHIEAHDLIKSAGSQLRLLVHRLPGAPQSPGGYSPTSPGVGIGGHPLANLSRASPTQAKAPMFQPMSPHRARPQQAPPPPKEYCYSPLPTTPILDNQPGPGGFFAPNPRNLADVEVHEYRQEKSKEKAAIIHQGYRTLPLIAPKPKTRHDVPMGSYLRHVHDPNWRGRSSVPIPKPVFTNFFPTPTYSKVAAVPRGPPRGPSNFERPIDDKSQLVHHQYNSPMLLYSQKNVDASIKEQTGIPAPGSKPNLSVNTPAPGGQSGPLSPGTPGNLMPNRPGTKLANIVDITLSPTFQMIQEEEKRSASPRPEVRTPPGFPRATSGPKFPGFAEQVSSFGSNRELIHQSGSFKTLMSSLYMPAQQQQEQ